MALTSIKGGKPQSPRPPIMHPPKLPVTRCNCGAEISTTTEGSRWDAICTKGHLIFYWCPSLSTWQTPVYVEPFEVQTLVAAA